MKINPEMVVMAREYRGVTQEQLARRLTVSQAKIAKLEGGIATDVDDGVVSLLSNALEFPPEFFALNESRVSFGSSALYYRKKEKLTAADRKRIHGLVNLLRINVKHLLSSVEIEQRRHLPRLSVDDYGGSAAKVAQAIRTFWQLPDGPVSNLTALVEGAGIIVVECAFGTDAMDSTSLWLAEMPPLIFMNKDIPGDRWRFTLAHELAHLVMHEIPHEQMEDEADQFAAEFLVPEADVRGQLALHKPLRLVDLGTLKQYWKVSMAALLLRAHDLGYLTDNQARYLWMQMSKAGYRKWEPVKTERERPKNHFNLVAFHRDELGYAVSDFGTLLRLNPRELESLHGVSGALPAKKPRLRLVE